MLPEILKDPLGFRLQLLHEYGDIVRYRFLRDFSIAIYHPDHLEHVLVRNHQNYDKGALRGSSLESVMTDGILASNGDRWKRQRRTAQPAFTADRIRAMSGAMTEVVEATVERWKRERLAEADIAEEMSRLTLCIAGRTLFGLDFSERAGEVNAAFKLLLDRGVLPTRLQLLRFLLRRSRVLPAWPRDRRFEEGYRRLACVVDELVGQRLQDPRRHEDLLERMLLARREDGGRPGSARQLRQELISILLASYETTATALNWTWVLLARYPDAEARLHDEVDTFLRDERGATRDDLPNLQYTRRVVQESIRLFPPAPVFPRHAIDDDELGGYRIPAGSFITISPYAIHRHPRYWPDPEIFEPDRFLPAAIAARPTLSYLPFSSGPRRCMGDEFALMEAQIAVATIARNFRIRPTDLNPTPVDTGSTLRPRGGLTGCLERRR